MEQPPADPSEPTRPSWMFILVVLLILVGFGLTAFYGARVLSGYRQIHHMRLRPGTTDVNLVRGWMTVPYIARAYRVPEETLWRGLGIPERGNRGKSLHALDLQYAGGRPGAITNRVKEILSQNISKPTGLPTPGAPSPTPP